ncbi:TPA: dTDP-4-amino-4,6-dideoxy-D-glucose aminotransferase VioA [Escherichia coli]|uniref:DegT/DnrJ/EryC1/StrS family aminotransferase n=1 Tax=Escherichia coli TaxID=562 RepID=A0A0A8J3Q8_ECOLX|nr:dTDP-4-amino-4,6-dideoxy-D-glucose aminotransferase VioA [Escherichia coli]EFA4123777.1 DegT/DnrJ/EryC1/StrS family aminotransferase [Escherichia coli O49:H9]EHY5888860.1 dTDP-4-amino-4,6-dideoxy-D-glucose aminotransferase VioA [Shigella sonnei]EAC1670568.1 DegT/DnrJ/EryC1/StrS family aminotransferase [Escherichia coli]EES8530893.1 DegT/DnrJ/EryC1/StrS family aminotransferase [Escherichia coli]EEU9260881.1 DegT/DnrJ/EryC1/StrS family aminotransferase [Escherichia coli]
MNKKIPVTQPFLPELNEFVPYLQQIWDNKWLTNNGPFHMELEEELCKYLGVKHISLFTNATIALVTALQALRISGEVITTPYSFVATSHSILWNNLKPVFVDIDSETFNIDPDKIESAITSNTTAIMPVHCYGNPCDVEKIQKIADDYGLKVIYDAAHAFGIKYKNNSLLNYGDLSILSFHATKVFNTFEGGAIICKDEKTKLRIDKLKNFGFVDEVTVTAPGINGKMSEVNAAFGLLQLKYVNDAILKRKAIHDYYCQSLNEVTGLSIPEFSPNATRNYSYFPVLINEDFSVSRDKLHEILKYNNILSRRYFYPLISNMPMYRGLPSALCHNLRNANSLSSKVLCLPIYSELTIEECDKIINLIKKVNER